MDDNDYDKDNSDGENSLDGSKSDKRIDKTLMEKKRRARINASITDLKALLLDTIRKEGIRHHHKMEKADILELAIKQIRKLQHQQTAARRHKDQDNICKYISGYNECAMHIFKYLNKTGNENNELKTRLLNHLASTLSDSVLGQLKTCNNEGPESMKDQLILINNKLNEQRKSVTMKETVKQIDSSMQSNSLELNDLTKSPNLIHSSELSNKMITNPLTNKNYIQLDSSAMNGSKSNMTLESFLASLVPKGNSQNNDNSKNIAIILPMEYLNNMNSMNNISQPSNEIRLNNISENCNILRNLDPCFENALNTQLLSNSDADNNRSFDVELTECDSSTDKSFNDYLLTESVHPDTYNSMWRPW